MTHGHVGLSEIAAMLGVSRQRIYQIADTDPTFPKPASNLHAGRIWHTTDIEAWIAKNR